MSGFDAWSGVLRGIGPDTLVDSDAIASHKRIIRVDQGSDDSLRSRLLYVAGDSERTMHEISRAKGPELDAIAEQYGLRRRDK